ncbi:WD40-repeat-containing domain protein [Piptocephalis cylindrospora]|uniref:methylated diphthine methylhydrolase n=1 Tax=Piptocephalis cylindrospora TaxID=1907219 RepID=A0A4P9XXT9_9FUNG|nr:WD40-repeat-containing domain protein [Piptocephalis cylindrospora]|eukprot:RKP11273.1 WD40-repeat-containing domain protein [Piptocephalis cylindrospora]
MSIPKSKSLGRIDTDYSACSVELASRQGWMKANNAILACGTYQLLDPKTGERVFPSSGMMTSSTETAGDEEKDEAKKRVGRLYLYEVKRDGEAGEMDMSLLDHVDTPAILDLKWIQHGTENLLVQAAADGTISLYRMDEPGKLRSTGTYPCPDLPKDETPPLILSLDTSTRYTGLDKNAPRISTSQSDGCLTEWNFREDGTLSRQMAWKAHDFEAWITAYDGWNEHIIYSGGDDACFRGWDRRMLGNCAETGSDGIEQPASFTNRSHDAGVCSIQTHPTNPHILVTGSYDEYVRLWDKRSMRRPIQEVSVEGGVWRLKWHPHQSNLLLAACMYGGCRVLSLDGKFMCVQCMGKRSLTLVYLLPNLLEQATPSSLEVIRTFEEHESMAYGIDWCLGVPSKSLGGENGDVIASCSFYDHILHVW